MTVGFGILGAGMISGLHADALRNSRKAALTAVCDLDESRARKLAKEYAPDARVYAKLDHMLSDGRVEVVDVVTPNHLHTVAVLNAAAAGKHVLCEKPPAMSLAETDRMIRVCRRAGRKFGIFVQSRLREPIQQMKKALDEGRFGRVLRADAVMKWHRSAEYYHADAWRSDRRSGAGVTIQHAFHYIDLLQYLLGPAAAVEARMKNLAHPDVELEDTLDALVWFANGATGTVAASTALWPGTDVRIELYGERGAAIMQGAAFSLWKFQDERPEDDVLRRSGDPNQATAGGSPTALASVDHQRVIDDCVDAIQRDREVAIPCESVRPTLEMALAMYQSDRLRRPISLPLSDESDVWAAKNA
ncbi:MAG TPA: Gfo/Idh/MocA family oxidoreductase [Thermoguttaceae bacterium]|nr:Gfo/Idh/MocA family oxidoreductase [Thermoguttaceae bacterium]